MYDYPKTALAFYNAQRKYPQYFFILIILAHILNIYYS